MSTPQVTKAPARIKAQSLRDSLGKTVRLLTKSGIDVAFRGVQPHVLSKGNKAVRLVLPEINDDAPQELIEAIQGYLDHEVGHIYYTPFARCARASEAPKARSMINILEDIRLEKLLPRDLPGTRENLERMYTKFIPLLIEPAVTVEVAKGDPAKSFSAVLVPGLRALAGQKVFQEYMDVNSYWAHLRPMLVRMPDLSKRLRDMETFDDVEALCTDILAVINPPKPEPEPEEEPKDTKPDPEQDGDGATDDDGDEADDGTDDDGDSNPEGNSDDEGNSDEGDDADGDDGGDGGEGHGDGEGTDDGSDKEGGDCSGDDESDDGGSDDAGDSDGDEDEDGGDEDTTSSAPKDLNDSADDAGKAGDGGKRNVKFTDALKQLEPTQRRALFMYRNRNASFSAIAQDLQIDEDSVPDLLRDARRKLRTIMTGAKN